MPLIYLFVGMGIGWFLKGGIAAKAASTLGLTAPAPVAQITAEAQINASVDKMLDDVAAGLPHPSGEPAHMDTSPHADHVVLSDANGTVVTHDDLHEIDAMAAQLTGGS